MYLPRFLPNVVNKITTAVDSGKTVYADNQLYEVIKSKTNGYLIKCKENDYVIGLTHKDGLTLNASKFFYVDRE